MSERIAVVGLGYVGLPVALAFARHYPGTVGYDRSRAKVESLRRGVDPAQEVPAETLAGTTLEVTDDPEALKGATLIVVAVPTPVDEHNRPDLRPLISASEAVGPRLSRGTVVVFESTVYPGVTEEICGPVLERTSGLRAGVDFKLGYSPERINPGDREHSFERIVKVVSGQDAEALERVAAAYGAIVPAGIHRAPSIRVAEAAKVIENTQRDLNIALMNELAIIFERMGLRTADVLAAARTKWNFLPFTPGLVGGHCIGVDPYYLTTKAEELGYQPQVILAGRRINSTMGEYIARRLVKSLIHAGTAIKGARVGILGLTFKENVTDLRNSRVPDIVRELREFGVEPLVHDPYASRDDAHEEYGIALQPFEELSHLDALVVAVSHRAYVEMPPERLLGGLRPGGVLADLKSVLEPASRPDVRYWSL